MIRKGYRQDDMEEKGKGKEMEGKKTRDWNKKKKTIICRIRILNHF